MQKEYNRLNVYDYIDRFCGWDPLEELLKYCGKYRPIFLSQFKTGGRVQETLSLTTENFTVLKSEEILLVENMELEKRYKKNKETGLTEKIHATRKPFPILLGEKLTMI